MGKHLLLVFFLIACSNRTLLAQSISGSVSNNFAPLSGATIRNITLNKLVVSDAKGNFKIRADRGDTLVTSYISYLTDTLILHDQIFLQISLYPSNNVLREVMISSGRLSPLEKFKKNQADYRQIYRIGDNTHLFFGSGGLGNAGVGLNIDALYSALSKEGKDARRLQRVLINDYHSDVVNERFTTELVARVTGYQGKQLEDFMISNKPDYQFMQTATDYELIEYIRRRVSGITSPADKPAMAKSSGHGLKIKFKMPDIQPNTRPTGAEFTPQIHP